jgi:hypothetical protein
LTVTCPETVALDGGGSTTRVSPEPGSAGPYVHAAPLGRAGCDGPANGAVSRGTGTGPDTEEDGAALERVSPPAIWAAGEPLAYRYSTPPPAAMDSTATAVSVIHNQVRLMK